MLIDRAHSGKKGRSLCVTIGFFDGVHLGHRFLIDFVCSKARQSGSDAALITFNQHPRKVIQTDYIPALLTTLDEKSDLLRKSGADHLIILDFDKQMSAMSAYDFMRDVLIGQCGISQLIIGYDHRFGCSSGETFSDYANYGKALGIEVIQAPQYYVGGEHISSSVIRRELNEGFPRKANELLGRCFSISGLVGRGRQIGQSIGFPTANIVPDPEKLIPAKGVYAAWALINGNYYVSLVNIGENPTIEANGKKHIEAHIVGYDGDLYGQSLTIELVEYIRSEQYFCSLNELSEQISRDKSIILDILDKNPRLYP